MAGLTRQLEALYDEKGESLAGKSTVVIVSHEADLRFLLSIINSKLMTFLYMELFGALALQGGYLQVNPRQVNKFPIRRIAFTTPKEERARLVEEGRRLYFEALEKLGLGGEK